MRIYINKKAFDPAVDATCYPIDKLIMELIQEDLILNAYDAPCFIGMLYFDKTPNEKGEYTINVTIKTDNGLTLSDTVRMCF